MGNAIQEHVGYHRILLVLCALFLLIFYPTEDIPGILDAGIDELFFALVFWIPPKLYFYFLAWIGLSDLVANLWRLLDFFRQKTTFWNYWPAVMDLILLGLLWWCYRKYINPLPESPEETEALLIGSSLAGFFG